MGLLFTVVYLLYMLASVATWLPILAGAGVQMYISALAFVCTLPRLLHASLVRHTPQMFVFSGFFGVLVLSPLLQRWAGGTIEAFREQIPYFLLLFLVRVNCDTPSRRKVLIMGLLFLMTSLVLVGSYNFHAHPDDVENKFIFRHHIGDDAPGISEDNEPDVDTGSIRYDLRLKAQGILDDPNDFGQALLITIALSTVFWGQGAFANIFLVLIPGAVMMYGIYLTHSRGALVAVAVTAVVAMRRRLKIWGAAILGALMAGGMIMLRFTGARQISVSAGQDRLSLWSEGLYLLKHSLGLGIGYHEFAEQVGHTAHNSILLVAVETGVVGLMLFSTTLVICATQLVRIAQPFNGTEPDATTAHEARCMEAALAAYLSSAWFLSRAYNPFPYLLVGLISALAYQASEALPERPLLPSWIVILRNAAIFAFLSLAGVYVLVRLRNI
jgi:hypothetical protein